MGCKSCGQNASNIAGKRVKPQTVKPTNSTPSKMTSTPTKSVTKVIRNGKVVQR